MLKGLEQVVQGRFRTGTVDGLTYNQDKQNIFAMLPKLFNPCLRDTLKAHLYYSTWQNFSVRQVTDSVTRGAWRLSRLSWAEGGVISWPRCQFVTGPHTETNKQPHSHSHLLPIQSRQSKCMSLDCTARIAVSWPLQRSHCVALTVSCDAHLYQHLFSSPQRQYIVL